MSGGEWDDSWLEAAYESSVTGDVDDAPELDDEEDDE